MSARAWFEQQLSRSWYGGSWWSLLLLPLTGLVYVVVLWRRHRFRTHPPEKLPVPVVVVGGLTVGGTGKSPVLMAIATALGDCGFHVGVVSRGYGGHVHRSPKLVDVNHSQAADVGDEPMLIAATLNQPVVVCVDRQRAARWLHRHFAVDVILSDDGLQHYGLWRDLEIAVLDGERRLGNGWLLPAGPLREPASRLATVDWLLERNSLDPLCGFSYRISQFRCLATGETADPSAANALWRGVRVMAATGLGQPEQFFSMLRRLGVAIEQTLAVADHESLEDALDQLKPAGIVLVTAKDAVKLPMLRDTRVWVTEISVDLPHNLLPALMMRLQQLALTS